MCKSFPWDFVGNYLNIVLYSYLKSNTLSIFYSHLHMCPLPPSAENNSPTSSKSVTCWNTQAVQKQSISKSLFKHKPLFLCIISHHSIIFHRQKSLYFFSPSISYFPHTLLRSYLFLSSRLDFLFFSINFSSRTLF